MRLLAWTPSRPSSSPTFELPGTSMPCGGVKLRDGFFHMVDGKRLFELMQVNTSLFSIFFSHVCTGSIGLYVPMCLFVLYLNVYGDTDTYQMFTKKSNIYIYHI